MRKFAVRCSARVLAVMLAILLANVAVATTASANSSKVNTDTFSVSSTYAFPNNYLCIKYTQSATITYKAVRYGPTAIDKMMDYWIKDIKVSKIKVTYSLVSYDSVAHACTTKGVKWKRMEAAQHWKGYACSFNPQISVAVPFSVGVGFWPSCGSKKQATWKSTYDKANGLAGPSQTQSTTGKVKYGDYHVVYQPASKPAPKTGSCYGSYITMHWYVGSADTSHNFPAKKMCLTPNW
jgi:hypothetical protein